MELFSALLAFVRGSHRSPVNSRHKGQWRGALMFSFICAWINGWANNRKAGDLRRHRAHYDVTVMGLSNSFDDTYHRIFKLFSLWYTVYVWNTRYVSVIFNACLLMAWPCPGWHIVDDFGVAGVKMIILFELFVCQSTYHILRVYF